MHATDTIDFCRPYLVIPKLIEQPTWGGEYIATAKGWQDKSTFKGRKIGQSYELFSGSNLSLVGSTDDSEFTGELSDAVAVEKPTTAPNSIALSSLIAASASKVLGDAIVARRGPRIDLLIKFTQALGNSFQVHIKDDEKHAHWKPKPEAWYYFEPGLATLGVKSDTDWQVYRKALESVQAQITALGQQVKNKQLTYEEAQTKAKELVRQYDPWQYVNVVHTKKDELIDLSAGGTHHSWEEDPSLPQGNILYELLTEVMDDVSTIRAFDRGKMAADGSTRPLQVDEYFELVDRSPDANDPAKLVRQPEVLRETEALKLERLLQTKHYSLDRLMLRQSGNEFTEKIETFRHLFVKTGRISVATASTSIDVGAGHACLVPAAAAEYTITAKSADTEVLTSF